MMGILSRTMGEQHLAEGAILVPPTSHDGDRPSQRYSHFFHLKKKYGSTAAKNIMMMAMG
jgi:hypothetical protein